MIDKTAAGQPTNKDPVCGNDGQRLKITDGDGRNRPAVNPENRGGAMAQQRLIDGHVPGRFAGPVMDEGAFDMDIQLLPGVSLEKSAEVSSLVQKKLMHFPELVTLVSRTGQTGIALEARGVDKTGFTGDFEEQPSRRVVADRQARTWAGMVRFGEPCEDFETRSLAAASFHPGAARYQSGAPHRGRSLFELKKRD